MSLGHVVSIYIAARGGEPLKPVPQVRAVAGCGLEGDRYYDPTGQRSAEDPGHGEATLIEREALEGLARDYGIELGEGESRRNIVTQGVALNHLVGKRFRVGIAVMEGLELAEPCGHLEKLTRPGVRKGLVHRGGLRARIVAGGPVAVGDPVIPEARGEE